MFFWATEASCFWIVRPSCVHACVWIEAFPNGFSSASSFCFSVSVTSVVVQVTTHSRLLIMSDVVQLAKLIGLKRDAVILCSLQAFDTEQQFCKMLQYVPIFH